MIVTTNVWILSMMSTSTAHPSLPAAKNIDCQDYRPEIEYALNDAAHVEVLKTDYAKNGGQAHRDDVTLWRWYLRFASLHVSLCLFFPLRRAHPAHSAPAIACVFVPFERCAR